MDNFKFNFLSRGQLESLNLDKFLLTGFKTITMPRGFSGNLIFAIIARMLCGNHLKWQKRTFIYLFWGPERGKGGRYFRKFWIGVCRLG